MSVPVPGCQGAKVLGARCQGAGAKVELTSSGKCLTDQEFCNQIRRAASKAPPLIAEGFIRYTPNEIVKYCRMARGELAEVQSRLLHAQKQGYFHPDQWRAAKVLADRAMAATTALLRSKLPYLKKAAKHPKQPARGPRGT